ncbi:MAG: CotH kinase family protein [Prevotella sp.]|nr:CotH kinase family protein [Prevotella sp.]
MNYRLYKVLLPLLLLAIVPAHAQRYDNYRNDLRDKNVKVTETNLPIVFISVGGQTIQKNSYILARMKIIDNGPGQTNYGDTIANPYQGIDYEGFIALKYRGNTSFTASDKKPYQFRTLKTDVLPDDGGEKQKVDILGMGKDNKWAFIAPWCDKVMFRDLLSFELGRPWMDYVPEGRFCEVILDGTYYGVYVLCERVSKGKTRLNLHDPGADDGDLTGDYHVEIDRNDDPYYQSPNHPWNSIDGSSQKTGFWVKYQYKAPENDEFISLPTGTKNALNMEIQKMEGAFRSPSFADPETGYRQYIDPVSFMDYFLSTELAMNIDGYRLSTNLYKYSKTRAQKEGLDHRWKMSLWDYNIAWGNANYNDGTSTDKWMYTFNERHDDGEQVPFYWYRLVSDETWVDELKDRWQAYREGNHSDERLFATIDSLANVVREGGAQTRNQQAWQIIGRSVWPNPYNGSTYDDELNYLKNWTRQRLAFLDKQLLPPPPPRELGPVAVKPESFTQDVVAEASPASQTTTVTMDGSGRTFYAETFREMGGFPSNRKITSGNYNLLREGETLTYELAPYDQNNVVYLHKASGAETLTAEFETPFKTSELFYLCTAGNGTGTMDVQVNYTDGTSETKENTTVRDWSVRNPGENETSPALGNVYRSNDQTSSDAHDRLFDYSIETDPDKDIESVTLTTKTDNPMISVFAFGRVIITPTAIDVVETGRRGEMSPLTGIYTIDGRRIETPQRGINIFRYQDGTSKKVLIK